MYRSSPQLEGSASNRAVVALRLVAAAVLFVAALVWTQSALGDEASDGAEVTVPSEVDKGLANLGRHAFRSFCASCHGPGGQGDGSIAEMMTVSPSDLTGLTADNDGVFPYLRTYKIIDGREKVKGHGTTDMPAWGDAFEAISESEEQVQARIEQLVHFIWSIQK